MKFLKAFCKTFDDELSIILVVLIFLVTPITLTYLITNTQTGMFLFGAFIVILIIVMIIALIINFVKWIPRKYREFKRNYKSLK